MLFLSRLFLVLAVSTSVLSAAEYRIIVPRDAHARVLFGAERLQQSLAQKGHTATIAATSDPRGAQLLQVTLELAQPGVGGAGSAGSEEGFAIARSGSEVRVSSTGNSGLLYGCLELAELVRKHSDLPDQLELHDQPTLKLRGTCIGMQKTYILPGRHVYEYPYTPDLFPFFYDKAFWTEYLDYLVQQRMNTLYLWNGHPFASLVRLKDYPYALEVSEEVFQRNVEMFRYITQEADRRGIWVVQMFYNILLSKPFAEKHGLSTQLSAVNPIAADYTRKSIAEFVRQYPNVGLLVCLGEALQDVPQQRDWCTDVILAGVKDGMQQAGLTTQPPVIIRSHATDESVVMPAALKVYGNLYTEAKFNGESLTTWEPRGVWQQRHLAMSKLGSLHVVNVHILANLEPFRYGAQSFIQKSVLAIRDRLGGSGLHLYPLTYWNWPYSPDATEPPLSQLERDWIWFEAWARYAWNPDRELNADREYWIARLEEKYGTRAAAECILAAYNDSGECAPRLLRRFGITEGNRQTFALGMTLDQLVNPKRYRPYAELWLSQAPPGERLDEFVDKELAGKAHEGETPIQVVHESLQFAARAVNAIDAAAAQVTKNREEFQRLRNDVHCIAAMTENYAEKVFAARWVLRAERTRDKAELAKAEPHLAKSLEHFRRLVALTDTTYHFANSMQTSQRRVPVTGGVEGKPANYHWRQLLPTYELELAELRQRIAAPDGGMGGAKAVQPLQKANFSLLTKSAQTFSVDVGARAFTDSEMAIQSVAPQLQGLTGIRVSRGTSAAGTLEPIVFETTQPVRVLVAYAKQPKDGWLRVPQLETDALAGERIAVETLVENAATVDEAGAFDVYAFTYPAGKHQLDVRGTGSFIVLGVVTAK
jgi:hypothetical protein